MNSLVICPGCGFRGQLPGSVGSLKSVVCPQCQTAVPVEQLRQGTAPAEDPSRPIWVDGLPADQVRPNDRTPLPAPAPPVPALYTGDYMKEEAGRFAQYVEARLGELQKKRFQLADAENRFEAVTMGQKQDLFRARAAASADAERLKEREAELQAKEAAVAARESELATRAESLAQEMEAVLVKREAELAAREADVERRQENLLQDKEEQLVVREAEVTAREAELAAREARAVRAEKRAADADRRTAEIRAAIDQLEARRAALAEERVALDRRAEMLDRTELAQHRRAAELDELDERLRLEQEEFERAREQVRGSSAEPDSAPDNGTLSVTPKPAPPPRRRRP
jgi:hypothetical protein